MSQPAFKAIETQYKGYRFRSRLEARWAVFFDALGVPWEYEREGYQLNKLRYLPDFFIKWSSTREEIIEIKGSEPTEEERVKAASLALRLQTSVYIFSGDPYENKAPIVFAWAPLNKQESAELKTIGTIEVSPCALIFQLSPTPGWLNDWSEMQFRWICQRDKPPYYPYLVPEAHAKKFDGQQHIITEAAIAARSARFEHNQRENRRCP